MNERDVEKKLRAEGFSRVYIWQDRPNSFYPDHPHLATSAHVILAGEMTLTMNGKTETFREGDRCDVPASAVHSARMGPADCRYLIGEK